jgi:hypothetical protein
MNRLVPALLVTATLAAHAQAQIAVGPVLNPDNGRRYYRTVPLTLAQARAAATQLHGRLAIVQNGALNTWLQANVASVGGNPTPCSIGFNDEAVEGRFVWENGDPVVYTNWNAGEPNNQGNEDVASINPVTGRWNDIMTGVPVPAIVEVEGPIRVPAEYPTIQAAIDAAIDGQTILVAPGTYVGNVDFGFKRLVVRSEAGAEQTTIKTVRADVGVLINGGQGRETVLEGFTIRPDVTVPGELIVVGQRQVLRGCRIVGGGAANVVCSGGALITDCLVLGPGISIGVIRGEPTTVQNCTLAGIVFLQNNPTSPTLANFSNCIVRTPVVVQSTGRLRATYCNIEGGWPGEGNFDADPGFANAPGIDGIFDLNDDFRLLAGSRCIDAGSNAARTGSGDVALSTDLDRRDRVVDDARTPGPGGSRGAIIDLGAYEFTPHLPTCPADFNGDEFVDFFDYDAFVQAFEEGC